MDWKFPTDVRGWLTEREGSKLAVLASGKRVLEIGSFEGRSTICMAQTAASVDCIDPFDGRGTPGYGQTTRDLFISNLMAYGVEDKVRAHAGTTAEIAPKLKPGYQFIFIDGAHDYVAVQTDVREALRLLAPGGVLAFHDYRTHSGDVDERLDPDVTRAVNDLIEEGALLVERVDTLAVVKPRWVAPKPSTEKPRVFLGMPRYGSSVVYETAQAFFHPTLGACEVVAKYGAFSSLLEHCFNIIWSMALDSRDQHGATHFAMIHSDVAPEVGWLDVMLAELGDADMISAIIPIKNSCGLTSTAMNTGDPWLPRRLTMREVMQLPETFGREAVGYPLLLNTGLWVCDLRREWCDRVCFDSIKRIVRKPTGERVAQCIPEDWFWSNALNEFGCKLLATRKVPLAHHGGREFTNNHAWGLWKTDETYEEAHKTPDIPIRENACASSS